METILDVIIIVTALFFLLFIGIVIFTVILIFFLNVTMAIMTYANRQQVETLGIKINAWFLISILMFGSQVYLLNETKLWPKSFWQKHPN